jgi:hypothetical protein
MWLDTSAAPDILVNRLLNDEQELSDATRDRWHCAESGLNAA